MRSIVRYLPVLLLASAAAVFLIARGALADSGTVSISTDQAKRSVSVTISDAGLAGKEISVICYDPGRKGNVNDLAGNKNALVYMNQYTVRKGTLSFTFKMKKKPVEGEYTLVISSEKGQVVKSFRMIPEKTPEPSASAKPSGKPAPNVGNKPSSQAQKPVSANDPKPSSAKKKSIKAPAGVKVKSAAKRKVTVRWKKVSGAKGYMIGTAAKKKGSYKTRLTVKGGSKKKATLKKLKSGKVYYIKVRAYGLSGKKKQAGKWSKAKKVRVR